MDLVEVTWTSPLIKTPGIFPVIPHWVFRLGESFCPPTKKKGFPKMTFNGQVPQPFHGDTLLNQLKMR